MRRTISRYRISSRSGILLLSCVSAIANLLIDPARGRDVGHYSRCGGVGHIAKAAARAPPWQCPCEFVLAAARRPGCSDLFVEGEQELGVVLGLGQAAEDEFRPLGAAEHRDHPPHRPDL